MLLQLLVARRGAATTRHVHKAAITISELLGRTSSTSAACSQAHGTLCSKKRLHASAETRIACCSSCLLSHGFSSLAWTTKLLNLLDTTLNTDGQCEVYESSHGISFAVAGDLKMGAQAFQCGFGFDSERQWDGVLARCRPDLGLAGLQLEITGSGGVGDELDCRWDVLRFNPDVPIIQVGPELGAFVGPVSGF